MYNSDMIPAVENCTLTDALWVMSLLEASNISAYFDVMPYEVENGVMMKGAVVVKPSDWNSADQLLKAWRNKKTTMTALPA